MDYIFQLKGGDGHIGIKTRPKYVELHKMLLKYNDTEDRSLERRLGPSLEQEMYKVILGSLAVPKSKEA